jgi:hypothetical protein
MARLEDLDQEHIADAAEFAARQLAEVGVAVVRLAPGDMTEYRFVIASPGFEWAYGQVRQGKYYSVTLCAGFGSGYDWHGGKVDQYYAAQKWTNAGSSKGTREWTGTVVALFLTAVSQAMGTRVVTNRAVQP